MTFSDYALAETAPTWDAQAICLALTASTRIEKATTQEEGAAAARRSSSRWDHLLPISKLPRPPLAS